MAREEEPEARMSRKLRIGKSLADPKSVSEHVVTQASRGGLKCGEVSELTMLLPLKPGGAERLRAFFKEIDGNLYGAQKLGTLHDMRFAILDEDTRLLFATSYDGEWDAYIEDFGTKMPDMMDHIFGNVEGWPGIASPDVKDFIAQYQTPACGWFVGHPPLSVSEIARLRRQDEALQAFFDALN